MENSDPRHADSIRIRKAYEDAEKAIANVGRLLRTTEAGRYMWADDHKSAMTGIKAILKQMKYRVPRYDGLD